MSTTIIIADDHPLLLNGTKEFLEKKWFKVIDTATDGNTAYNKIINHKPDIAILDFDMPKLNGLEVAQEIQRNQIQTKVIILTLHKQESLLNEVGKTIHGYITKDSALEELEQCLEIIKKGHTYIGKKLKSSIHFDSRTNTSIDQLTATEIKILKYLEKNLNSTQIAEELFISKRTVEKHRSNIIKKLEIDTTNQNALFVWLKQNPNIFNT
ncbi:response regulator transcription factor [Winogradskyella sp. SYSU M77433]|uniref:response regulator transcription factor n=1 Tax=Winogradskyella sp. SYSU M77433 TaxID=3042722 RepID=UPI00247FD5B9|nr:response regulator transcription factor [Winogradskyella sp. SYSU M77433]MDH7914148.1 response regulator transcription factor [Winogradskyella sp. SYSU M77433]